MTTTAESTTETLNVAGIGPVELTVEERGDGTALSGAAWRRGSTVSRPFAQLLAEKDGNRVLTPTHPGFGGTPRPDELHSVRRARRPLQRLARRPRTRGRDAHRELRRRLGRRRDWLCWAHRTSAGIVLLDAVGIEVEGHPVADVSGLSVPEIQALSFHDPTPFRVDPATIPDAQKAIMAANGAALAVYAGSPAMADPTLLGRLGAIVTPTLVLWGESDRIVEPAYGRAYAAAIDRSTLRGAARHRAHAPDGDPRSRAAKDLGLGRNLTLRAFQHRAHVQQGRATLTSSRFH